eukprot:4868943-Amphidinium_carterae.1
MDRLLPLDHIRLNGQLCGPLCKESPHKKVYVNVVSARGLRDADSMIGTGTSDPYCICSIAGKAK